MIRYSASDSFIFAIDENDHLYSWGKTILDHWELGKLIPINTHHIYLVQLQNGNGLVVTIKHLLECPLIMNCMVGVITDLLVL